MRQVLFAMLVTLAIVGGSELLSLAGLSPAMPDGSADAIEGARDQVPAVQERLAGGMFLMAGQDTWKCLEKCADDRSKCEKENKNKNKPGTKQNWDESTKCEEKKLDCIDRCQR